MKTEKASPLKAFTFLARFSVRPPLIHYLSHLVMLNVVKHDKVGDFALRIKADTCPAHKACAV